MDLDFTKEELETLKLYINEKYEAMNQLLVSNCETDIALLSDEVENKVVKIPYSRENIIENLMNTKILYKLFMKNFYKTKHKKEVFYRGTNLSEIERLKIEPFIDRIWSATTDKNQEEEFASNWKRPVGITITLEENVPYINVGEILNSEKDKNFILIAPFTKIKSIEENKNINLDNSKYFKYYNIVLEKQTLDKIGDIERNGLYNYILENSYPIKRKLEDCIKVEKENAINFDNIRKMEQLLRKYENAIDEKEIEEGYSDIDRAADYSDVERITQELNELKKISTNVFEVRKQNIEFVNMWKRNIAVYMIAECREIEELFKDFEIMYDTENIVDESEEENVQEEAVVSLVSGNIEETDIKNEDATEFITDEENENSEEIKIVELEETKIVELEETQKEENKLDENELQKRVKQESRENITAVEKLLSNIKNLITKQQNHAKIAGNMGASYSALNNAFEMRKTAEALLEQLEKIDQKIKELTLKEFDNRVELDLELMSKTNIEISTLINYLNNPKIAVRNSKVTRFDEMAIIEENELKRRITEKVRDIRAEAELKKLKDDLEIVEEKGGFSRFIGLFTGRNKIDDFMIEQIQYRQMAVRKSLSRKLNLAHNYSIHELMAEITMFVDDNEDDELIEDDVLDLKAIAEELRRNYIILESKVQAIVEKREGKYLPYDNRKMSKREIIELETYRFLNKYGYDITDVPKEEEPKYQDTIASEISRIVEYINSSNII